MKKKLYICTVIMAVCLLCFGCEKDAHAPVFELEQDKSADMHLDEETLRALLKESLEALELSPVIQVTCSCTGETQVQQSAAVVQESAEPVDDGKVNINTADVAALQTLNGIGESRAQAIISYRESFGAFQAIEDIMQVDGIKDGVFNKIRDAISVG